MTSRNARVFMPQGSAVSLTSSGRKAGPLEVLHAVDREAGEEAGGSGDVDVRRRAEALRRPEIRGCEAQRLKPCGD